MGIFGRLFGRKKKEEQAEAEEVEESRDMNYPITPASYMPRQQAAPAYPSYSESDDKEFQVLSSKLDALNAKLDVINQRLTNLERLAGQEEKPRW